MYRSLLACLLIVLAPGVALAQQDAFRDADLPELLKVKIRTVQHLALNPTMVRAVRRQNAQSLTPQLIEQRDKAWQETKELTQFKRTLQQSQAGRFLRGHVEGSGSFNEAFLTDGRGANVAAFPATSDYFQGDEEKWTASYNGGAGQVFVGPLEYDESTGVHAVQISAPVLDRGATIGVLVVGVTLDYLDAKKAAGQ